jgi:hypothetical protein
MEADVSIKPDIKTARGAASTKGAVRKLRIETSSAASGNERGRDGEIM